MMLRKMKEEGDEMDCGTNGNRQGQRLTLFDREVKRLEWLVKESSSRKGRGGDKLWL